MSEDLTKKFAANENEPLSRVINVVQGLTVRIEKLDQKVEERLYDTRPMWEVNNNVHALQEGQARLERGQVQLQESQQLLQEQQQRMHDGLEAVLKGQERLNHDSHEIRTSLRDILRRMSIFNDTLVAIQADYRDIYDRVRGLELKSEVNGQCDL
ncbi:MAG TPA: hypothetical protein VGP85_15525 [Pyrinomonadaceae bacterium]|jgi:predicted  nucleic acid-binding Zn-ribbon protein|nr:hypothetical protein [Pyrinomonadaceae bacterium]